MTKSELIMEVAEMIQEEHPEIKNEVVREIIDATLESIVAATLQGEEVRLHGFAILRPLIRSGHMAYSAKEKRNKMSRPYAQIRLKMSRGWKEAFKLVLSKGKKSDGKVWV